MTSKIPTNSSLASANLTSWKSITDDVMPTWLQDAIKAIMLPMIGLLFFLVKH